MSIYIFSKKWLDFCIYILYIIFKGVMELLTINKKKTKNIIIRIPEDERDDLRRVVEAKGISLSDYIRALINEDLNK